MSIELKQRRAQTPTPLRTHSNRRRGKNKAVASMVLGIISLAFIPLPGLGLICAIVGLFLAVSASKDGFYGGIRTAGFILSVIGTGFGMIVLLAVWFDINIFRSLLEFGRNWRAGPLNW